MTEVKAPDLNAMRGFIFDVDGTLALADRGLNGYAPLPGSLIETAGAIVAGAGQRGN